MNDFLQLILRQGEDDGDRLQLGNDHETRCVGRVHNIALVDQPDTGPAVEGRSDRRVVELNLRSIDVGLVGLYRGFKLLDEGRLGIDLLLGVGDRAGCLKAPEIAFGILKLRLVPGLRGDREVERGLEGAWIDLDEDVARFDILPFLVGDFLDLAVDPRLHRHGIERLDRAESGEIDGHVLLLRSADTCGDRRGLRYSPSAPARPIVRGRTISSRGRHRERRQALRS